MVPSGRRLEGVGHTPRYRGARARRNQRGRPAKLQPRSRASRKRVVDGVFLLANLFGNGAFHDRSRKAGLQPAVLLVRPLRGHNRSRDNSGAGKPARRLARYYMDAAPDAPKPGSNRERVRSQLCREIWQRYRGRRTAPSLQRPPRHVSCSTSSSRPLTNVGRNPTRESYVAALESVGEFETGAGGTATFSPERHDAIDEVKRIEWADGLPMLGSDRGLRSGGRSC